MPRQLSRAALDFYFRRKLSEPPRQIRRGVGRQRLPQVRARREQRRSLIARRGRRSSRMCPTFRRQSSNSSRHSDARTNDPCAAAYPLPPGDNAGTHAGPVHSNFLRWRLHFHFPPSGYHRISAAPRPRTQARSVDKSATAKRSDRNRKRVLRCPRHLARILSSSRNALPVLLAAPRKNRHTFSYPYRRAGDGPTAKDTAQLSDRFSAPRLSRRVLHHHARRATDSTSLRSRSARSAINKIHRDASPPSPNNLRLLISPRASTD